MPLGYTKKSIEPIIQWWKSVKGPSWKTLSADEQRLVINAFNNRKSK